MNGMLKSTICYFNYLLFFTFEFKPLLMAFLFFESFHHDYFQPTNMSISKSPWLIYIDFIHIYFCRIVWIVFYRMVCSRLSSNLRCIEKKWLLEVLWWCNIQTYFWILNICQLIKISDIHTFLCIYIFIILYS